MFSKEQEDDIQSRGSHIEIVKQQVADFKTGFPFLDLDRPATIGDGIVQLSEQETAAYVEGYEKATVNKSLLKFVPASGAATRMFKDLFEYLAEGKLNAGTEQFIAGIQDFAFYTELVEALKQQGLKMDELLAAQDYQPIVRVLLEEDGLGYGSLPKGLLAFHKTENGAKTPLEEHLIEGAKYALGTDGVAHLHFTVSPEHQKKFELKLASVVGRYEQAFEVKYQVSFSQQKSSTDTLAVDLKNEPFLEDGKLLFRPAGHGALLANLNDLEADVVFVKNIDNVVPDHLKADTITYKKALASMLIAFQQDSFGWLGRIAQGEDCTTEAQEILKAKYGISLALSSSAALAKYLNRPVRVCGMVVNTGEPGGGPFWVKEGEGTSLQIAETAQIDLTNEAQAAILKKSSHFNPVDLVCGVKDFKGRKFDLIQYRNNKTGFITQKSRGGKAVKAMELPGLWNGAMADWVTLFVEVPITTFNPVKTVNDLLKPTHQ
ncbi:DUF4301 family protein [Reichenbachiella carrageenanivorans]|uniref:DUF4301 family protein n=1 Tax=Reichenbachiella carrageenanivorans TaxID=2979869 RepID=A0ABY6D0Q2_9BACT|nr:DUF4301 family protein [Reichenbachiella carrageenanivorans]UXX79731.1 DUF4301 family protein [Reichenbachiella carrageenanivorans]